MSFRESAKKFLSKRCINNSSPVPIFSNSFSAFQSSCKLSFLRSDSTSTGLASTFFNQYSAMPIGKSSIFSIVLYKVDASMGLVKNASNPASIEASLADTVASAVNKINLVFWHVL